MQYVRLTGLDSGHTALNQRIRPPSGGNRELTSGDETQVLARDSKPGLNQDLALCPVSSTTHCGGQVSAGILENSLRVGRGGAG